MNYRSVIVLGLILIVVQGSQLSGKNQFGDPKQSSQPDFVIIGNLKVNNEVAGAGKCIAAFVNDELRGTAEIQVVNNTTGFLLSINVFNQGEEAAFQVYDPEREKVFNVNSVKFPDFEGAKVPVVSGEIEGNKELVNFIVTIPVIEIDPEDVTIQCNSDNPHLLTGVSAVDGVDGDISHLLTVGGAELSPTLPGDYVITYDVTNASGNPADQKTRVYHVIEDRPPIITVNLQEIVLVSGSEAPNLMEGVTAEDECDGDLTDRITIGGDTVDVTKKGSYTVIYEVRDSSSNFAQATRVYRVTSLVPQWRFSIDVAGSGGALQIGQEAEASESFDDGIDSVASDAVIYLENGGQPLSHDIRGLTEEAHWTLAKDPTDSPLELSWDIADIPEANFISLYEVDATGVPLPGPSLIMNNDEALRISAGERRYFRIRFAPDVTVALTIEPGWNLVSLPIQPAEPDVAHVFGPSNRSREINMVVSGDNLTLPETQRHSVWQWDTDRYRLAEFIEPLNGYFVHATDVVTSLIDGLFVSSDENGGPFPNLKKGWNLLGTSSDTDITYPLSPPLRGFVWSWNGEHMEAVNTMVAFLGYWVFARENGTRVD